MMDVVPLKIFDKPSYVWRGVMIDTARHFVPHDDILRLIDGMYAGKLNKLHIHATDSTAWTLRSDAYPELAEEGLESFCRDILFEIRYQIHRPTRSRTFCGCFVRK